MIMCHLRISYIRTWCKKAHTNITCCYRPSTVLVSNDNDDNRGQRRPWLRWWSWSSSVMFNGIDLMGALWDKFQAGALHHSLDTSHVFLECTLDPPPPASHLSRLIPRRIHVPVDTNRCQILAIYHPLNTFWSTKLYFSHNDHPSQFNHLMWSNGRNHQHKISILIIGIDIPSLIQKQEGDWESFWRQNFLLKAHNQRWLQGGDFF